MGIRNASPRTTLVAVITALWISSASHATAQGRVIAQFPYAQSFSFIPGGTATTPNGPIGAAVFPATGIDGGEFLAENGTSATMVNGSTTGLNNNVGAGGVIRIQTSGSTAPTTTQGFIGHFDFTGRFAESISIDWSKVTNGTSTRSSQLRIAASADSGPFVELGSASFDNSSTPQSGTLAIELPSDLDGVASVRFRIYAANVAGAGTHPRVVVDNLRVDASADEPLPVELTSFTATRVGETVAIEWSTASEHDNAGFEVLRASDADTAFVPIGSYLTDAALRGLGTSALGRSYRFDDAPGSIARTTSVIRYRLVDVAVDGTRTDHGVREVESAPTGPSLPDLAVVQLRIDRLHPLPAIDDLSATWTQAQSGRVTIDVIDSRGERVLSRTTGERRAGVQRDTIDTSMLSSGAYTLAISVDGVSRSRPFTIVR